MGFYYETGKELCCKVAKPVQMYSLLEEPFPLHVASVLNFFFLVDINNKLGSLFISSIDVIEVM